MTLRPTICFQHEIATNDTRDFRKLLRHLGMARTEFEYVNNDVPAGHVGHFWRPRPPVHAINRLRSVYFILTDAG